MRLSNLGKVIEKLRDKNVLISGGLGFIGSHLVEALKPICNVTVLSHTKSIEHTKLINADLRNEKDILTKMWDVDFDIVFHMAAQIGQSKQCFEVNADGTRNILETCRKKDIRRFIYSSSMSVFGDASHLPVNEEHPKNATSPYGISKLFGEFYCNEYHKSYGVNTTILRYSSVFGPRQNEKWVIPIFIDNALNKKPLQVRTASSGDFIYVKDVVKANILAATCKKHIGGEDFNIGSGIETTIKELAYTIKEIIPDTEIVYEPAENEIAKRFVFDISKIRNVLGYKPDYSLKKGLTEQIKFSSSQRRL